MDLGPGRTLWLAKPLTFMNESGRPVGALARYHRIAPEDVAVVYDDLTIDLGLVKVSVSGSDGGHNGVASLLEHLGGGFSRLRLGIGPRNPPEMDLKDFVLSPFTPEQLTHNPTKDRHLRPGPGAAAKERARPGDEPAQPTETIHE